MEWLKQHWEWIAAIAVGIPVLYWLYQTYQTNQANAAQAAQSTDLQNQEQADEAAYAQQIALGNLQSDSTGGATGSATTQGNIFTSTAPVTPPVSSPALTGTAALSVSGNSAIAGPGMGYDPVGDTAGTIPIGGDGQPTYPVGSPQAVAAAQVTTTPSSPVSSAISTLLGSGGSTNDTAPVAVWSTDLSGWFATGGGSGASDNHAVQGTTPDLSHLSNGSIPQHSTLVKTPTPVEISSIGGGR